MDPELKMIEMEGLEIDERYRLERYLDEGAFGAVFKASHIAYGVKLRDVAIKIAKQPMLKSEARATFADALILAQLVDSTPNAELRQHFITVHDAGHCNSDGPLKGHPYMVMELIAGGSLEKCLRLGGFPLVRAINYFDQMLTAMAFMHRGNSNENIDAEPIVHRDLKPGNIMVTRQKTRDVIKVADFGLAVQLESHLSWTSSGGTLSYLAPESLSHDICSPQSDVYMLGLIFYEMLTGENPFSQVGSHLFASSDDNLEEMRKIHIEARQMEQFKHLEQHYEMRERPALCKVIRTALAPNMTSRTFNDAFELKKAWDKAKKEDISHSVVDDAEYPWHVVRNLTAQAEQCFAAGDRSRSEMLLKQAMQINRDKQKVPDNMLEGKNYYLMVQSLIHKNKAQEAGSLAAEGYSRKKCRYTCMAMASYYKTINPKIAIRFSTEADKFPEIG
jgi:serine/threonine protein kinase